VRAVPWRPLAAAVVAVLVLAACGTDDATGEEDTPAPRPSSPDRSTPERPGDTRPVDDLD
jgi:hypothetical protein